MKKRLFVLILSLGLAGCAEPGMLMMGDIAAHTEDGNVRADGHLKDDPKLATYRDLKGRTPLHIAADSCNDRVVMQLIDLKADVNAVDLDGKTPLHYAADPSLLRDLNSGPKRNDFMNAKLMARYETEKAHVIQLLIEAKADVNKKNREGKSFVDLTGYGKNPFFR